MADQVVKVRVKSTGRVHEGYKRFWDDLVKAGKAEYVTGNSKKQPEKEEKKTTETKEDKAPAKTKQAKQAK